MASYEKTITDDSGLRVDPKRKNAIDELLNLLNQVSINDIEYYIDDIRNALKKSESQVTFSHLPVELREKIMYNLDYKNLSRMRQVDKTAKEIADSFVRRNVTEQISIELLDKIICLPYYLNCLVYRYNNITSDMNISGWKDITITGDKLKNQFVGPVKIKGSVHIEFQERILDTTIKGEGYFDSAGNPHFKLVLDNFTVPGFIFWNEDNRYIYCNVNGNDMTLREVKRLIYPYQLRILFRYGFVEDQRTFYTNFNNEWTTDYISFYKSYEEHPAETFDYEIINVNLPNLGNKIATIPQDEEEIDEEEIDDNSSERSELLEEVSDYED